MAGVVIHFSRHVNKMHSIAMQRGCQANPKKTLCRISLPHTFLRHDAHPLTFSFKILYFLIVSPFLPLVCMCVCVCTWACSRCLLVCMGTVYVQVGVHGHQELGTGVTGGWALACVSVGTELMAVSEY